MRVLLFGAGTVGQNFYLRHKKDWEVIGFADNNPKIQNSVVEGLSVYLPSALDGLSFDRIIITVQMPRNVNRIVTQLLELGISEDKIDAHSCLKESVYVEDVDRRVNWLRNFAGHVYDNGLEGQTAECGVYCGDFSAFINQYFPNRKLYLFDTFAGFDAEDLHAERGLQKEAFLKSGFNSSELFVDKGLEEVVMGKMAHPENCILKKGRFPASVAGVEDRFCFVSLDMDLYQPMLAGLNFFWSKMVDGGILLLHDYYCAALPGVKQAVEEFEQSLGAGVPKMPIGDFCSLAVVKGCSKPEG